MMTNKIWPQFRTFYSKHTELRLGGVGAYNRMQHIYNIQVKKGAGDGMMEEERRELADGGIIWTVYKVYTKNARV